jgi:hypothetical protein
MVALAPTDRLPATIAGEPLRRTAAWSRVSWLAIALITVSCLGIDAGGVAAQDATTPAVATDDALHGEGVPPPGTAAPPPDPAVAPSNEPAGDPPALQGDTALAECQAKFEMLKDEFLELNGIDDQLEALVTQYGQCQTDFELGRTDNIYINDQLQQCRQDLQSCRGVTEPQPPTPDTEPLPVPVVETGPVKDETPPRLPDVADVPPRPSPELVAELEAAQVELASVKEELAAANEVINEKDEVIAALTSRLDEAGVGMTAQFGHAGGSAYNSVATRRTVDRVLGELPELDEESCEAAMVWLLEQSGTQEAFSRAIWVWRGDMPLICSRTRDGGVAVAEPGSGDEAHVVVFR